MVLYALALVSVLPKGTQKCHRNKWMSLVMLPVLAILFLMIRGGVGEGTANVSSVYYSTNQYLNHSAVNSAFNMFYSLTHQQDFASEFQYYDDEKELNSLMQGIYNTESVEPDTLFTTKRPNIILVVWEGCGASLAGCVGADGDITPNLDRLAKEGILFTNCYANSFRTDRGLVSINTGWLGYPTASLMKIPEKCEKLPGIAKKLKEVGYHTEFWYGGDINFTNMGGFMLQNGYEKTYSDKDFARKERSTDWGVPDGPLFDKVLESIKGMKSPFFSSIMTLSSHEPWEVPYKRLDNKVENSFAYTDDCIGRFVEGLKACGKWNNTLLIIVSDHGAVGQEGKNFSSIDVMHIPLLMTGGAIRQAREIGTIMNQSDIPATLFGQFGISHDEFVFSRDVMSKSYTYPCAVHCSKIAFSFCDSTGLSTYDLDGNMVVQNVDEIGNNKEERVRKGKAILQTLYKDTANR
jgi:phosphoglycerol transferase MdoB-like AlkP superfamily enzyme